jgi:formylglycine-generating enzyme required for sulfatase activity
MFDLLGSIVERSPLGLRRNRGERAEQKVGHFPDEAVEILLSGMEKLAMGTNPVPCREFAEKTLTDFVAATRRYGAAAPPKRELIQPAASSFVITSEERLVTVPEVTLPNGTTVPSFQVSQYHWSRSDDGTPWVNISYHDAQKVCQEAGMSLITELQALAIAHDIVQQDINWTGGKVGLGKVFQGLHKGTVEGPRERDFLSSDPEERRWHELSNGSRIYDFAGHVFSWVFDDVQGDENGIVARPFAKDSPSISTSSGLSAAQGIGWAPQAESIVAGDALLRGGCWYSGRHSGVFYLDYGHPGYEGGSLGFRCTK